MAAIASEQHGLILSWQLAVAGIDHDGAHERARRGALHRAYHGVYRVGHRAPSLLSDLLAAVLAAGPKAALSHLAAARLWGLVDEHGQAIDVTARMNRRSRAELRLHRLPTLDVRDLAARERVPCTSLALTVLDVAGCTGEQAAHAALDEARFKHRSVDAELRRLRGRYPRRRGWSSLDAITAAERGPGYSRNDAERLLLRIIRGAGLPEPLRNHRVHGFELDLYWPERGLAVELDGRAAHGRPRSIERDRARDTDLAALGIDVRRFSWRQISERRLWVAARLGAALARRSR